MGTGYERREEEKKKRKQKRKRVGEKIGEEENKVWGWSERA